MKAPMTVEKANLIIFDKVDEEFKVFLSRRSKTAIMFPDFFSFFGGKIEEGETPEEALIREIREELDFQLEKFELLGIFETPGVIKTIFYSKLIKEIVNGLPIREGQYGKWFSRSEVLSEENMVDEDKYILNLFFELISK